MQIYDCDRLCIKVNLVFLFRGIFKYYIAAFCTGILGYNNPTKLYVRSSYFAFGRI